MIPLLSEAVLSFMLDLESSMLHSQWLTGSVWDSVPRARLKKRCWTCDSREGLSIQPLHEPSPDTMYMCMVVPNVQRIAGARPAFYVHPRRFTFALSVSENTWRPCFGRYVQRCTGLLGTNVSIISIELNCPRQKRRRSVRH